MTDNYISRDVATTVVNELRTEIEAVFARHGLATPTIRTRYGDGLKITIEGAPLNLGESGVNLASKEALAYERYHNVYNLVAGALGIEFVVGGVAYRFDGLATQRPKNPICGTAVKTGRSFVFRAETSRIINAAVEAKQVAS